MVTYENGDIVFTSNRVKGFEFYRVKAELAHICPACGRLIHALFTNTKPIPSSYRLNGDPLAVDVSKATEPMKKGRFMLSSLEFSVDLFKSADGKTGQYLYEKNHFLGTLRNSSHLCTVNRVLFDPRKDIRHMALRVAGAVLGYYPPKDGEPKVLYDEDQQRCLFEGLKYRKSIAEKFLADNKSKFTVVKDLCGGPDAWLLSRRSWPIPVAQSALLKVLDGITAEIAAEPEPAEV